LWVPFSSADERAESEKGFKGWDKNGDGFLIPSEVPEGPRKNFKNVDKNGDGKVNFQEHLLATVGPEEPEKRKVRKPDSGQFKRQVIRQSWDQEKEGYDREYFVSVPEKIKSKIPVLFVFHGGGGQASNMIRGWAKRFSDYLVVSPQGYRRGWNISDEATKAPDTDFFKEIIKALKINYPKADLSSVSMVGFSNGAGYIFRLLIEIDDENLIRNVVPIVSSMEEGQYHDGSFWQRSDDQNGNYDVKKKPVTKSSILTVHGTEDRVVPYAGGMRGRNARHVSAQETAYAWARLKGYEGEKIDADKGKEISPGIVSYAYKGANVTHLKIVGAGHGLGKKGQKANQMIADFIRTGKLKFRYVGGNSLNVADQDKETLDFLKKHTPKILKIISEAEAKEYSEILIEAEQRIEEIQEEYYKEAEEEEGKELAHWVARLADNFSAMEFQMWKIEEEKVSEAEGEEIIGELLIEHLGFRNKMDTELIDKLIEEGKEEEAESMKEEIEWRRESSKEATRELFEELFGEGRLGRDIE